MNNLPQTCAHIDSCSLKTFVLPSRSQIFCILDHATREHCAQPDHGELSCGVERRKVVSMSKGLRKAREAEITYSFGRNVFHATSDLVGERCELM